MRASVAFGWCSGRWGDGGDGAGGGIGRVYVPPRRLQGYLYAQALDTTTHVCGTTQDVARRDTRDTAAARDTVAARDVADTFDPRLLRLLVRASQVPKRSEERGLDLPDEAWALVDGGGELRVHDTYGPFILGSGAILAWPTGERARNLAGLLQQEYDAGRVGSSAELDWTTQWPTDPGFYWFFGFRAQDRVFGSPSLSVAVATLTVERTVDDKGQTHAREFVLVTSGGHAILEGRGFVRGVWAPIATPDEFDWPTDLFDALPEPPAPANVVHCVHGGATLCGAAVPGPGQLVARSAQLALITCGGCRAQAERL